MVELDCSPHGAAGQTSADVVRRVRGSDSRRHRRRFFRRSSWHLGVSPLGSSRGSRDRGAGPARRIRGSLRRTDPLRPAPPYPLAMRAEGLEPLRPKPIQDLKPGTGKCGAATWLAGAAQADDGCRLLSALGMGGGVNAASTLAAHLRRASSARTPAWVRSLRGPSTSCTDQVDPAAASRVPRPALVIPRQGANSDCP